MDNMERVENYEKIILSCTAHGVVSEVILDTTFLLKNLTLPVGLHSIVSPESIAQLGSFWVSIQEKYIQENVVLALTHNDRNVKYLFSGYLLDDKVLICGSAEMPSMNKVLEEIFIINNEQANHIRMTEKKVGDLLKENVKQGMDEAILNDFSSLNNELINNKRELVRKNKKIELLNTELNAASENLKMFTHSVSHDLREPVRMVKSFLALLNRKLKGRLDEKEEIYFNMATDGANRLSRMLEGLLEYHQTSQVSLDERVDLNDVLMEVKQILKGRLEEKCAQVNCEKLPVINGSFIAYQQVFQNLISNAIKFVPEGKTPIVSIQVKEEDRYHTIMVKDNGIGIPKDKKQDIFNLFHQLNSSEQYEGTGMGLAMVRKSIERMGGSIWLDSIPDEGTTFYFTIVKQTSKTA